MPVDSTAPRLIALDRDGTIIFEREYLSDPREVELLPGAATGIRQIRSLGHKVVVITNQSGVARGFFTMETVAAVHRRVTELLAEQGAAVDRFYICPHHPDESCICRKPSGEMLSHAADDFGLEITERVHAF